MRVHTTDTSISITSQRCAAGRTCANWQRGEREERRMNPVVGAMPAKARWTLRTMLVVICAFGLLAAASGSALAKKHKPKPKTPAITTHTPITRGSAYLALGD